jgi:phosphatidylserine/phosphatidylglycerophosphate/cardiolipin synthase-like enzyme
VSHAKFVIVHHELLLPTSANFSYSAERRNIEFGLLIHDSALCESVEGAMSSKRGTLYVLEAQ